MKALLFNMHDVILLLTVVVCALLSTLYFLAPAKHKHVRLLMGFFLLANALIAVHTLIFWSEALRYRVFDIVPHAHLLLSSVLFLVGPLLWMLCRYAQKPYLFNALHLFHYLPAIVAPVYLYVVCFRFESATQRELFLNFGLYGQANAYYFEYISSTKLFPLAYAGLCIFFLWRHRYSTEPGSPSTMDFQRLKTLVLGFTLIWLWSANTHFTGPAFSATISDYMGIIDNYLKLLFVLYLTYNHLLHLASQRVTAISTPKEEAVTLNEAHKEIIIDAMMSKKVFLSSQLTLERLAGSVGLSPREVSTIINRSFKQNFHEFVNSYRIEEAKKMLSDPNKSNSSINDIAHDAGFNSKATFNRFFKKFVLLTPSEYRLKNQSN